MFPRAARSQCRSCAAVMVLGLCQGMAIGWTSPALAKLSAGEGPLELTLEEITWIASLFDLGMLIGVGVSGVVFTRLGRRQTLLVGPSAFLAWVLLTYLANSVWMLCAARLLAGAGLAVAMSFSFIYIGEVTTPRLRGSLILTVALLLPLGQLVAYSLGPYVSYTVQSLSPLPLILLCFALIIFCMDESPFYLAAKTDRLDEVKSSLTRLRSGASPEKVSVEAESILRSVKQQMRDARSWRETFSPPGAKRAALVVIVVNGSFAILGVTTVLSFTQQIFEAAGTSVPPEQCAIALILIKMVMVVVAIVLIERLGRRLQLSITALLNAISLGALASYFLVRDHLKGDVSGYSWVPIASLIVFISASGAGVNAVPHVLMGELLTERAKSIVAPVAISVLATTSFVFNKSFLLVGTSSGFYVPFALYAVANLLLAIFTQLVVPETKGKTLVEVQEMLRGGRRPKSVALTEIPARPDKETSLLESA